MLFCPPSKTLIYFLGWSGSFPMLWKLIWTLVGLIMWNLWYLPSEAWRSSLVVRKQSRPKVGSGAKCSRLSVKGSKTNPHDHADVGGKSGKNVCRRCRPLTGTTKLSERRRRLSLKSNTHAGFYFFLFFLLLMSCQRFGSCDEAHCESK